MALFLRTLKMTNVGSSCVGFSFRRLDLRLSGASYFSMSSQSSSQFSPLKRISTMFTTRYGSGLSSHPSGRLKFNLSKEPPPTDDPKKKKNANRFFKSTSQKTSADRNRTTMLYLFGLALLTTGMSYAAVPLYRMFCQASGYGGTTKAVGHGDDKVEKLKPNKERRITVRFNADTAATMQWNFRPQQSEVTLYAGETALAFYTAKNPTEKPIDGISTYNVIPFEAGLYFNKIQCFCFEEQRLNPGEEVDMPVFFYIDPEFLEDPFLEEVDEIHLSYTFFESKPGLQLPVYH